MLCLLLTILGLLHGQSQGRYTSGQGDLQYYPGYDGLMQDMMLKRLQDRYDENLYQRSLYDGWQPEDDIRLSDRGMGRASLRDQEYLEHSSNNDGYQYISGGAGEGKQHLTPAGTQDNTQEVKSDEDLPFYCHPPNPCPKGFKEKDGCQDFVKDTAESQQAWITKMQYKDMCQCDEEHMFSCPQSKMDEQQSNYIGDPDIDSVLEELLKGEKTNNPYMIKETRRDGLVAKKSPQEEKRPIMKRSLREKNHKKNSIRKHKKKTPNPYLQGEKLKRVAKKG